MICVCVESPLRGDLVRNRQYAMACMLDSLLRGEAPFLGHLLYPFVLDDCTPSERQMGISAHLAWLKHSDFVALYVDLGESGGMCEAVDLADFMQKPYVRRRLGANWAERVSRGTAGFEQK